jgi:hypothetical protein
MSGSHRPAATAPVPANEPVVTLAGIAKRFANGTLALDKFDLAAPSVRFRLSPFELAFGRLS